MSMQNSYVSGALVLIALIISGCNGQEDFSDAIIGGPIIDSTIPDPNFDPADPCSPRVVGNLIDGGTVRNIGFTCGGFFGNTGDTGLEDERAQNRFVCPLNSTSVTFFIGGETERVELGSGAFRRAVSKNLTAENVQECEFDDGYIVGRYDADGPYLYAIADLFDGPVRSDVVANAAPSRQVAQNISALLNGLDNDLSDDVITINDEANRLVFDSVVAFPDFDVPFVSFVDPIGIAQNFLDTVEANVGPGAVGMLPTEPEVQARLIDANERTAAGIYRFDLFYSDYILYHVLEAAIGSTPPIYKPEALLSDFLLTTLQANNMRINPDVTDPEDPDYQDVIPIINDVEFLPYAMVDRYGRMIGGGAFDVARFVQGNSSAEPPTSSRVDRLCPSEKPLYLTLDGSASLNDNLQFSNMKLYPLSGGGDATISGRFIDGVAYSNVKTDVVDSSTSLTDYQLAYTSPAHDFVNATDKSLIGTTLCGVDISGQIVLSYRRQGLVMPELDSIVMNSFFGAAPAILELDYLARADADDVEPDTSGIKSRVTVHEDGTIMTDISPPGGDGNTGLAPGAVAPGEYVIGMISSVIPGGPDPLAPSYLDDAQINIVVFNYGPTGTESAIAKYGSHFRARFLPNAACSANVLVNPADETLESSAYWFDTYDITNWLLTTTDLTTNEERYQALRTKAYGYIAATRLDCAP